MTHLFNHAIHRSQSSSGCGIMIVHTVLYLILANIAACQNGYGDESMYNSGLQYSAYGGAKSFPSHILGYKEGEVTDEIESKFESRSAKRNQNQQVDESMVAQMLNNPNAMKMVLKYLTKQNLKEQQKKWHKMSKSNGSQKTKRKSNTKKPKKKTTTKPPATTTTKKPKTKSPILQITQIKRRNDNGGPPKNEEKQKKKRRPRPPGGDFFDLAELFKLASLGGKPSQRKKSSKPKDNEKRRPPDLSFLFGPPIRKRPPKDKKPSPRPTPPANFDNQNNPQLFGDKPKLEYFGPSDFVPQHPYALPMKQHGPMKLTYMSAKDFPNIPKYGLIPIPR